MACRVESDEEILSNAYDLAAQHKRELDRVTALLCALTKITGSRNVPGLEEWIQEHAEMDRKRLEKEAENKRREEERTAREKRMKELTTSGLSKLTPEERKALGLK